jgi:hypothetical protein
MNFYNFDLYSSFSVGRVKLVCGQQTKNTLQLSADRSVSLVTDRALVSQSLYTRLQAT